MIAAQAETASECSPARCRTFRETGEAVQDGIKGNIMRALGLIAGLLLILAGAGAIVVWGMLDMRSDSDVVWLGLTLGVVPVIGGGLLTYRAWQRRRNGKEDVT